MSYYVLTNMTKSLLFKKSNFMEINQALLGLVNFEFVSGTEHDDQSQNIPLKLDKAEDMTA